MNRPMVLVCVLALAMSPIALGADTIDTKWVSVNELMNNFLAVEIPINIPVPKEYQLANLKNASFGYSYWLHPGDVSKANSSDDLPQKRGYLYATITTNVGYDAERDFFNGVEEPQYLEQAKALFSKLSIQRLRVAGHSILLMRAVERSSKKPLYAMYLATNIDTNVIYIVFRPAANSEEIGDAVWGRLRQSLIDAARVGSSALPPSLGNSHAAAISPALETQRLADVQESVILQFARLAAAGNVDDMFSMFSAGPIEATGAAQLKAYLATDVIPHFSEFDKLDTYSAIRGAQFEDGTQGNIHYTYLVNKAGKLIPLTIALRNEQVATKVMNVNVGRCVANRHPVSEGRCDR